MTTQTTQTAQAEQVHQASAQCWIDRYDERVRLQIQFCRNYEEQFNEAGAPGHTLMRLVAWLAQDLDDHEQQYASGRVEPEPNPTQTAKPAPRAVPYSVGLHTGAGANRDQPGKAGTQ